MHSNMFQPRFFSNPLQNAHHIPSSFYSPSDEIISSSKTLMSVRLIEIENQIVHCCFILSCKCFKSTLHIKKISSNKCFTKTLILCLPYRLKSLIFLCLSKARISQGSINTWRLLKKVLMMPLFALIHPYLCSLFVIISYLICIHAACISIKT